MAVTINCSAISDSTGICGTLESAGAGLGVFIQYMGVALPFLLILLIAVGIIGAIGYGIAHVIRNSISKTHVR